EGMLAPLDDEHVLACFDDLTVNVSQWNLVPIHRGRRLWAISTTRVTKDRSHALESGPAFVLSESIVLYEKTPEVMTVYACDDYDIPGQYTRQGASPQVVRTSDLPDALRQRVSKLQMPLTFAQTPTMQLADIPGTGELMIWGEVNARGEPLAEKQ